MKKLKMLSLQRRLERYQIIYTWKVLEGIVPNCGIEVKNEIGRNGRMCRIPNISTHSKKSVQSIREQSFQINGLQLFNLIPKSIRNMTRCGIEDFKMKLDKFLENVPDEPNVRGLVHGACTADAKPSNSILDQGKVVQKRSHGR